MNIPAHSNALKSLILGGARSGKSNYAENLAIQSNKKLVYIATATVHDDEMRLRVNQHKKDRESQQWISIEEPLSLAQALQENATAETVVLVDCLTMWLNNLLADSDKTRLQAELSNLLNCLENLQGEVIFVSNEVGMGIVPMGELTRQFVDESGRLHQQLAQRVDTVVLMVAGLPLFIKPQK